jgi:hypothetical protein
LFTMILNLPDTYRVCLQAMLSNRLLTGLSIILIEHTGYLLGFFAANPV